MKEIELINKRKPREKHFLQEDGTIVAKIYDSDIHYEVNGKYEEIDNTLIKEKDYYYNSKNSYKVKFNETLNDTLMTMTRDECFLEFKLENAKTSKMKRKSISSKFKEDILYNEVLDGLDIEYTTLPNKVKETIVLNNRKFKKIKFAINTNLSLIENGKMIDAYKNNQLIFRIEKPFMKDSKGEINNNISYKLLKHKDEYKLELLLDDEWLKSSETKFPVYIDPTITNIGKENNVYDTYIFPGDTGTERYEEEFLKAGVEKVNNNDVINRTLLKFELPEIGTGSEIIDAEIVLTGYLAGTQENVDQEQLATIHRVTKDWNENTANWETMGNSYDEKVEGIICCKRSTTDGTSLLSELCGGAITNLVKNWYRDTKNYGVLIKAAKEEYVDNNYPSFFSKDNAILFNDPKPYLSITYRNLNGIEEYLDYKRQTLSQGATYVNTYNGNLVGAFNVGNTLDKALPINAKLIYNTNDVVLHNDYGFGEGYKLNYNQTIKLVEVDFLDYLEFVDEDGTIHYLAINYATTPYSYNDEDGIGLKAVLDENNCIMTDKDGNVKTFIKYGDVYYLSELRDSEGNVLTITLDEQCRITNIKDRNDESLSISYNTEKITITNPASVVNLMCTNGKITSITNVVGTGYIQYNELNLISCIIDTTGNKLTYEYCSEKPYRMRKVSQYGQNNTPGQFFSLEYGFDSTTIIDNKGNCETLIFNGEGNLLSVNSLNDSEDINNAYSITQEYGMENKLLSSNIPVRYIKNHLKNTSFESDDDYFTLEEDGMLIKSFSTEYAHSGKRSLKLVCHRAGRSIEQLVAVPKGSYYTFSGYFKLGEPINITLLYGDKDGHAVKTTQLIKSSSDFERNDISIYYEEGATTDLRIIIEFLSIGVAYIDDIQLEVGEVANMYNIMENSDFEEGFSDWEISIYDENGANSNISKYFSIEKFNEGKINALKVKMEPYNTTCFKKVFPISGKANDLYTISFWYKDEGVIACRPYAGNSVTIYYVPEDGEAEYCILSSGLNCNDQRWQYFTYSNRALEDFKEIQLIFQQNTEANNFYITNLSFYKEITSGEYMYDQKGNLVSIKDHSRNDNVFNYDENNQLINMVTPKGNGFKLEYDNIKTTRVINAITTNGTSNFIKYDENGNPILARSSKKYKQEINDGVYRIRNKGTTKFIKAEMNYLFLESNTCSNTNWLIEKVDDKYKISYAVLPEYSITCLDTENVQLSTINQNNLFVLEQNENGSYCIKAEFDNEYRHLKANGDCLELGIKNPSQHEFEFYIELIEDSFIETSATYSEDGKFLTSVTDSNLNTTHFVTNEVTGKLTSEIDAKGNSTEYFYNNKENISEIINGDRRIIYNYNEQSAISEIIENDRKYTFTYDDFLRTKNVKIGDSIVLINNDYAENNGELIKTTYGNGNIIEYEYDQFDRISKTVRDDNYFRYLYDNNGNVAKVISETDVSKYTYDGSNRLYRYQDNDFEIKYKYDSSNNVVEKEYKVGNISNLLINTIDNDELVTEINYDNSSATYSYEYDSLGRQLKKTINNTFQINYEYLKRGKRTTNLLHSIEFNNNKYEYAYDELNNFKEVMLNNQLYKKYYYDRYEQLIKEEDYIIRESKEYTYDTLGNIIKIETKDLDSNILIESKDYQYNNQNWKDQLTNYDGNNIQYDSVGNPTSIGNNITLSWINGRMLNSYTDSSKNMVINYKYNEDGIRREKEINGEKIEYLLEDEKIIYEKRGNTIIHYMYDLTGVSGLEYNNNKYHFLKNGSNDVIGITNGNEVVVNYEYDSWGKLLSIKDGNGNIITDSSNIGVINPFRYRSYYYDTESELYYLNSRYYNPTWGRFINADGILGANDDINSYNLYAYVSNNPINKVDPDGNFALLANPYVAVGGLLLLGAAVLMYPQAADSLVDAVGAFITGVASLTPKSNGKTTKSKETKTKKKSQKQKETENHYVYTLRDPITNKVEYVGRTTDVKKTETRHKANPYRTHLQMKVEYAGISRIAARGTEQILIEHCKTKNRNEEFPMNNQINGLRNDHPYYKEYWDAAVSMTSENLISCN